MNQEDPLEKKGPLPPPPPINQKALKGTLLWYWERERQEREWERLRRSWWEECRAEEEAERQHRRLLAVRARAVRWEPPPAGS